MNDRLAGLMATIRKTIPDSFVLEEYAKEFVAEERARLLECDPSDALLVARIQERVKLGEWLAELLSDGSFVPGANHVEEDARSEGEASPYSLDLD